MKPLHYQRGSYIVEVAIAGAIFMFMLFAVVEIGRAVYTWSALNLATQRGARVAAVCPVDDPAVRRIAIFGTGENTGSTLVPGLDSSHIAVSYLDEGGAETIDYQSISYVRVSISNYTHSLLIPVLLSETVANNLLSPTFATTLPAESLGYEPDGNTRVCFV